ncbi:MAG: hypothetical protein WCC06_07880 [Candidatus Aminicenantales bacterium]
MGYSKYKKFTKVWSQIPYKSMDLRVAGNCCNLYYVVPVDIDFTGDSIYFNYSSAGSGTFASGTFNGYVFTDLNDTTSDFLNVEIDPTATTLGVDSSRVFFNEDQIFVNVASLYHNSYSKIKLDVDFAPVPVPGAIWLLASGLAGVVGLRKK